MAFAIREAYCPAYWGNSNEAMWPRERARYLTEVRSWGYNWYGDVHLSFDASNPYAAPEFSTFATELNDRKLAGFRAAADVGMKLDLHIWPNHVFLDQLRPHLAAGRTQRVPGQRVVGHPLCPSKPEARAVMLENFDRQFRDFADQGIPIAALTAWTYDCGGCMCDDCAPYILTFAGLLREIRAVADRHFPAIQMNVVTWWWTPEEHRLFDHWVDEQGEGWLDAMVLQIGYGATRPHADGVPTGSRKMGLLHTGYGDIAGSGSGFFTGVPGEGAGHFGDVPGAPNRDIYGRFGAVVAARRIPETLDNLAAAGAAGFQIFSEGTFDDVNKALAGALGSGKASSADAVLREYASRYFGARGETSERWARWLTSWGERGAVDLRAARVEFEHLAASATPSWRLEHLRSKLLLEELDRELAGGGETWDDERMALADRFDEEQEGLKRQVYGLGPVRFIHSPKYQPPVWYGSWQAAVKTGQPTRK